MAVASKRPSWATLAADGSTEGDAFFIADDGFDAEVPLGDMMVDRWAASEALEAKSGCEHSGLGTITVAG